MIVEEAGALVAFIVVVAIVIAMVALVVWMARSHAAERVDRLRRAANGLRFRLTPGDDAAVLRELRTFPLVQNKIMPRVSNVLSTKRRDVETRIFDFEHQAGSKVKRNVVWLRSPHMAMPQFSMTKHTRGIGLKAKKSGESPDSLFEQTYEVHGLSEEAKEIIFDRYVRDFFARHPGLGIEVQGNDLLVYTPKGLTAPEDLRILLDDARQVLRMFEEASEHVTPQRLAEAGKVTTAV